MLWGERGDVESGELSPQAAKSAPAVLPKVSSCKNKRRDKKRRDGVAIVNGT